MKVAGEKCHIVDRFSYLHVGHGRRANNCDRDVCLEEIQGVGSLPDIRQAVSEDEGTGLHGMFRICLSYSAYRMQGHADWVKTWSKWVVEGSSVDGPYKTW